MENVERTNAFFERFGALAVILARFVPIVRTFAPVAAGVGHMNYKKYSLYNAIGALHLGRRAHLLRLPHRLHPAGRRLRAELHRHHPASAPSSSRWCRRCSTTSSRRARPRRTRRAPQADEVAIADGRRGSPSTPSVFDDAPTAVAREPHRTATLDAAADAPLSGASSSSCAACSAGSSWNVECSTSKWLRQASRQLVEQLARSRRDAEHLRLDHDVRA